MTNLPQIPDDLVPCSPKTQRAFQVAHVLELQNAISAHFPVGWSEDGLFTWLLDGLNTATDKLVLGLLWNHWEERRNFGFDSAGWAPIRLRSGHLQTYFLSYVTDVKPPQEAVAEAQRYGELFRAFGRWPAVNLPLAARATPPADLVQAQRAADALRALGDAETGVHLDNLLKWFRDGDVRLKLFELITEYLPAGVRALVSIQSPAGSDQLVESDRRRAIAAVLDAFVWGGTASVADMSEALMSCRGTLRAFLAQHMELLTSVEERGE